MVAVPVASCSWLHQSSQARPWCFLPLTNGGLIFFETFFWWPWPGARLDFVLSIILHHFFYHGPNFDSVSINFYHFPNLLSFSIIFDHFRSFSIIFKSVPQHFLKQNLFIIFMTVIILHQIHHLLDFCLLSVGRSGFCLLGFFAFWLCGFLAFWLLGFLASSFSGSVWFLAFCTCLKKKK